MDSLQPPPSAPNRILASARWLGSPLDAARVRLLLDWGVDGFLAHQGMLLRDIDALARFVPPRSIKALSIFSGLRRAPDADGPAPFRMSSTRDDDKRDALKQAIEVVELADRIDAQVLTVPFGGFDSRANLDMTDLLLKSAPEGAIQRDCRTLWEERLVAAADSLSSYRSTLSHLLDHAARYHRQVAIEIGGLPPETPNVPEARKVL